MADTVDLLYDASGPADAPAVILLHGFPLSRATWTDVMTRLSSEFRVVAPDLRGHGASPAPEEPASMELMARDVLALADKLGLRRFHLVGHSMGGYVALALVRLAPDRVDRLVLVTTKATPDSPEAKVARRKQADMVQMDGVRALADLLLPKLVAGKASQVVREEVRRVIESARVTGTVRALEAMAERPDSVPTLREIKSPTLVVVGGEDQLMPAAEQDRMTREIPNARQVVVPGVGHVPMMEAPAKLADELRAFLRGD